jgi:hypothetical protein
MSNEQPERNEESLEARAKQDTFGDLHKEIASLVQEKKYGAAEGRIKTELSLLAGVLGGDQAEQFRKLRKEFESTLPKNISDAINPEGPVLRGRTAAEHAERLGREIERSKKEAAWIESGGEESKGGVMENPQETNSETETKKFVAERSWDVPKYPDEILPGLILSVSNLRGKTAADREKKPGVRGWHTEYYKVLTGPILLEGTDPMIEVFDMDSGKKVDKTLAELGILPYLANGMWDAECHVAGWMQESGKEKKKGEGKSEG